MGFKTINLEEGMPLVHEAIKILEDAIKQARKNKIKALKLIHGYGSSGVGGRIRRGVLKNLEEKKQSGQIQDYIKGEQWSIFNAQARSIMDDCPALSKDGDLDKFNIGITIVIL
jgi:hypothetical protein